MRGRHPAGPEYVEHLHGSAQAKERLRLILETMRGSRRVADVCRQLGICEQRFHQLRAELLQAALERLEARPAGRPRRPGESAETAALKQQVEALHQELQVAQVREEIALALPRVVTVPAAGAASGEARSPKTRRRRPRR